MRYFLCGNTGISNRGCEAIIRSTVKLLNCRSGEIYLATFSPAQDRLMSSQLGINLIPYSSYSSSVQRYFFAGFRKIFKKSLLGYNIIEEPLFSLLNNEDICLNIGGDTYCYNRPVISLALNKFTFKNNIKNILWCCSVEKSNITKEILEDLNRYEYIFAREQLTVSNLLSAGIKKEKIVKVCDPAFFLDTVETALPENFILGNTVGINVSEMVINKKNPFVYSNVVKTIEYIIDNTDMNICLIPHVYNIEKNTNDYPILKKLKEQFNSDRISLVSEELNCEQLKYIISKCRFFIGARTHSTIAAYSSCVPTLVLGYSVKSKGIATDLFGTYGDYVIPYDCLTESNELLQTFIKIIKEEDKIKERLSSFLPEYKKQLTDAVKKYIRKNSDTKKDVCEKNICTGCSACSQSCPSNCITMIADNEGFLYPHINHNKCVDCNLCKQVCPVLNKVKDTLVTPQAIAAINKNEEIRLDSSSGGVFTALAETILDDGGVVFGAGFDGDMKVVHKFCTQKNDLSEFRMSKYVQSDIGDSYLVARNFLEEGKKVLFTGTPCQIGGLYAYLNKDYDNLFTQDIICHGVPSPKVFREYLLLRERNAASTVRKISFRNKKTGWKKYSVVLHFENGKEYSKVLTEDTFMKGFLNHLYLRPSCSLCSFKQIHRQSDITLADFWGSENLSSHFNDNKGVSLVLVHSSEGQNLFERIAPELLIASVDFSTAISENTSYNESSKTSILKKYFFKYFPNKNFDKLIDKYLGSNIIAKLRRGIIKFFM